MAASRFLPSGAPLVIERVEWDERNAELGIVSCIGRIRGPLPPAPPVLVVRDGRRAERFEAASHGTDGALWTASFRVGATLGPALRVGSELELGSLLIALPRPGRPAARDPRPRVGGAAARATGTPLRLRARAPAPVADTAALERRLRTAEEELVRARQMAFAEARRRIDAEDEAAARLEEAERRGAEVEAEVARLRSERAELAGMVRALEAEIAPAGH